MPGSTSGPTRASNASSSPVNARSCRDLSPPAPPIWATWLKTPSRSVWLRPNVDPASVEELAAAGDELVASGSSAEQLDRRADQLADPLHVITTGPRQVVPTAGGADVLLPPRHRLIGRLAVLVMRDVRQRVVETLASEVVARADLQQRLV